MFDLAIDSKLRGCDLVRLKIGDVALNGSGRPRATMVQQKTGSPFQFEIAEQKWESVSRRIRLRSGLSSDYLFPTRVRPDRPISTHQ